MRSLQKIAETALLIAEKISPHRNVMNGPELRAVSAEEISALAKFVIQQKTWNACKCGHNGEHHNITNKCHFKDECKCKTFTSDQQYKEEEWR